MTVFPNMGLDQIKLKNIGNIQLDAAGLVALADLSSIPKWTALTGASSFTDAFFLAPRIHKQHSAPSLSDGEYPATAALTSGYIFRVENEATVLFLQSVGKTGHLVNLVVDPPPTTTKDMLKFFAQSPGMIPIFIYVLGHILTVAVILVLVVLTNWWALAILSMLITARICNTVSIQRRSKIGWKGASEPDVDGDLLILLSRDRWIRLQGKSDDLKVITSGQWLQAKGALDEFLIALGTVLVYLSAALTGNSSTVGKLVILSLLLVSAGLLELCIGLSKGFRMYGYLIRATGEPTPYKRRLDLAEELIKDTGREDWAIGLGMIKSPSDLSGRRIFL